MDTYGKILSPGTIRFERILPGPIEKVWAYLTESEKRGKWLAKGEMELIEGGKVELYFLHTELSPSPGVVPEKYKEMENGHHFTGVVLKVNPPFLLSFTWENQSSEVLIELAQKNDKVLLTLTHSKLGENKDAMISTAAGWHTHLEILAANLIGASPREFWERHKELENVYSQVQIAGSSLLRT